MKAIWKYTLRLQDEQEVDIPEGAVLLDVQMQNAQPQLWALVSPQKERVSRIIKIHGTGHILPDSVGEYVASFQMAEGALVFHVFDKGEPR